MKKSFTLMEIMIVVAILIALTTALLFSLNPWGQINKSQDSKRKRELSELNKAFEDFYNDKGCYPKPDEVCYPPNGATTCNICGNESASPSFAPYLSNLPCDPQHLKKEYRYQVDNITCPSSYKIFTKLSNTLDPIITIIGCDNGCGPSPDFSYNYTITSPNTDVGANPNICSLFTHLYTNPYCQICEGDYNFCKSKGVPLYTDPGSCVNPCIID